MQKNKSSNENPYLPKSYKVIGFFRETPDNFTLKVGMKIKHEPGQFVQVSAPGFGEAPISICSDSKEFIELNVHEVGNVTRALSKLRKGDTIYIRGPYGKGYPMEALKGNNIMIIGGGCGVAPLKGVINYIQHNRNDYKDIFLILGYRSEEDIIFKKDVKRWEKQFHLEVTLDKGSDGKMCYQEKQGFVTDVLRNLSINNENKVVFICGPPVMIKPSIDVLQQKGFNDDQIFISAERLMYCGIGVCCHCMIRGKFTCKDGPVFRYDEISNFKND